MTRVALAWTSVAVALGALLPHPAAGQATAPRDHPRTHAILADRLVDPVDGSTVENVTVLVEDGVVTAVGSGLAVPAGMPVLDLAGQTLLPGLMDAHVHLMTRVPQGTPPDAWVTATPMARRAMVGVQQAREMLLAGFTTVRDIGNSGNYVDVELSAAVQAGTVWGPTIIPAGMIIAPFGGQSQLSPERPELGEVEYIFADTRDEMVRAVRRNIHFGAQLIKIVVDDQPYIYSAEDIRTMVDEAAGAGRKVSAHVLTERGARNAIEGGVASLEHAWRMSPETMDMARAAGTAIVTSDLTESAMGAYGWPVGLIGQFRALLVARLAAAYEHDLDVVFGSDLIWGSTEKDRGTWSMEQIDSFIESGVTPLQILQSLTVNPARLLSLEGTRGRIAEGYAADIIAVPANPLDDVSVLKQVTFVMKDGRVAKAAR